MNDAIFAPERMPARDGQGWVQHPDLDNLLQEVEEGADAPLDLAKIAAAGFEAAFVRMGEQRDETDTEWHRYFIEEEADASNWTPDAPAGEGWQLVAVYDSDDGDGPSAMFVRPLSDSDFVDYPDKYPDAEVQP